MIVGCGHLLGTSIVGVVTSCHWSSDQRIRTTFSLSSWQNSVESYTLHSVAASLVSI